ncbi:MAG TPA: ATP-binding protein [Acidobacteriaceae bacterium]|nr:ATP-binding protein [Acidobacteriaceae bacterium]
MTGLPSIALVFMLLSLFLLGALTLRLAARSRQQKSAMEELKDALSQSREYAEQQQVKLAMRSDLDLVKDEFISTVSHELRTPLTSIRGALGLLSAGLLGNVEPKAQNLLRIAASNTERLIRLINDILDLERMDSGRAPLTLRRCSMYDLAYEAVDTMSTMADGAGIKIELTSNAPRDSIYFDADSDRIMQVLTNLLSNALKFSPTGSSVQIQIDSSPNSLLLRVVDRGRGIPLDKLDSVFDRFQQVESSDASKKGGTGLGLAICRSIIQQHGGAIWAQPNRDHVGTTLWVQLSRSARASDAASAGAIDIAAERGEGLILVCDDDPGIRVVVAEQLRQHGYDILEAGSGEEVIALSRKYVAQAGGERRRTAAQPISAILLDLYMPGLSGWETLQRLREDAATAAIPVVILSVIPPTDRPMQSSSAQGWVQKPFNENLLLAELKRVLRARGDSGHILLVEQDEKIAGTILAAFEGKTVRIDHVATLQQAVDRCLLGCPDLLILDLALPDGDGFSLVDWLRRQPGLRSLPLVIYTSRAVSEAEMAKLQLGPTEFLRKDQVQPHEVQGLVLGMVERLRGPVPVQAP